MWVTNPIKAAVMLMCFVPTAHGMEFKYQANGGNCARCAWVLAEGTLDQGTTEKLKAFVAQSEYRTKNIRFNSPGGNLIEALKLGEFLRQDKWDTFVGEENPRSPRSSQGYVTQQSSCYSACVYAFAGGVHRTADDKSLGVHQFYRPDDAVRPDDKTVSATDLANMQHLAAILNEYVRGMGVDPRLVSMASAITPWEPIHLLSSAELTSLNLDNSSTPANELSADWRVQPIGDGAMAITTQAQDSAGRLASLAIMCLRSMPDAVVVRLSVRDDTTDWRSLFASPNLSPPHFTFALDGVYGRLDSQRLASPVEQLGNGVTFAFLITKEELARMMGARSVELDGAASSFIYREIGGPLGGTFSMLGSPPVIDLALKNCVSQ
jgi:hypothetical protein